MKQRQDILNIFFNDESRTILYNLVDRKEPSELSINKDDDIFEPTISAVFLLFSEIMQENTPDLYKAEWLQISEAIKNSPLSIQRLPISTERAKSKLVMTLEDTISSTGEINNFELSKKLAGFNSVTVCSILFHVQKHLVAKKRGEVYNFPEIQFKG
ncbi:MAG: hypothetical protein OQL19_17705 [Gammaproteobacteria bacterium]|nr:hypothetical protein [Gammaproteobacteria bacterium]